MMNFRGTAALAIAVLGFGFGCNSASAGADAGTDPQAPAARIGARDISNADLDARVQKDVESLRQRAKAAEEQVQAQLEDIRRQVREQEYGLRKKALTDMLTEMEAQAQGLSTAALVEREVTAKISVGPADVDAVWDGVKAQARATKEQVRPQLEAMARQRKIEVAMDAFHRRLLSKHSVRMIGLQPSRAKLEIAADAPALGPADAPITLIEYTDYQCPFCQQAEAGVQAAIARYGDKIRLVYRDFPLDFHAGAKPAGVAARCAGEQGRFWEMHRNLLTEKGSFDEADLKGRARRLDLDFAKFEACFASGKYDAAIEAGLAEGKKNGVDSTPTFFLNGRVFKGAPTFEFLEKMIEEELFLRASRD
jgi:protein-disulfide isomerase